MVIRFIPDKDRLIKYPYSGEVRYMEKCGVCGHDVEKQPQITAEGKCDACGARLAMVEEGKHERER